MSAVAKTSDCVVDTDAVLSLFSAPVANWFRECHAVPTEPQLEAWPRIKRGENTLIHSPTGSGKTLAAFLSALDSLYSDPSLSKRRGIRTLYISPLKALGYDVERNLREPMRGIEDAAAKSDIDVPEVRADVRTGDTPSNARARMMRNPPHILITTPESLYLILTSPRASAMLSTVETVIVDEIHTLCANKRGVHLSISLERLERVAPNFQRIGLSATQRPLSEVARLLGGQSIDASASQNGSEPRMHPRPVSIVDCPGSKRIEVSVHGMAESPGADPGSIWPKLIPKVLDDIAAHDTTLVFTNSRRQAENTADRLNSAHAARVSGCVDAEAVGSGVIGAGVEDGPFMAHHGSLSDTIRRDIEAQLKSGKLPALVGTSSLELGIDIGSIDLVVQLQSPKTVTQGLQRIGRAGHSVGATSVGKIYATHPEDLIEATVVAKGMQERSVEAVSVPSNSLDVLAQQIVAAVAVQDWSMPDLYRLIKGAYPYADLTYASFESVVKLVSGHYPRELFSSLRARIHWDRTRNRLQQLPGTRMMAIGNGGAIVDRGAFAVVLPDRKTRIGELDEEFVLESGEGDAFMLGSQVWRVSKIEDDRVIAEPAPGAAPRMPFWRGDFPWRPLDLSQALAKFRADIAERIKPHIDDETAPKEVMQWLQHTYPIDDVGARQIIDYVRRQIRWSGEISSHKTIIVETYQDSIGDLRIVVHSPFGGRINGPWSVAIARELHRRRKTEPEVQVSDDGIMFRIPQADDESPVDFIGQMTSDEAKQHIIDGMIDSPLFGAVFRQNAYRALLLPSLGQFRRTPFWLQRLRSKDLLAIAKSFPDFPIVLETYRDALEDFMDMPGLACILDAIQAGEIAVRHVESDVPSPVARALSYNFEALWMYSWDTPKAERGLQTLDIDRDALAQLFRNPDAAGLLRKEAIEEVSMMSNRLGPGMKARTETELAQLFSEIGDLTDDEIAERSDGDWKSWIASLAAQQRVVQLQFDAQDGSEDRWVASPLAGEYRDALTDYPDYGAVRKVVARFLARSGPVSIAVLQSRYAIDAAMLNDALDEMMLDAGAARGYFTNSGVEEWLDLPTLARIQERTLAILRSEVRPSDPLTYQSALLHMHGISRNRTELPADQVSPVIDILSGVPLPTEQWTQSVLPSRVGEFTASQMNDLVENDEFRWIFCDTPTRSRRCIAFVRPGEGSSYLPEETLRVIRSDLPILENESHRVYEFISAEGTADSEMILAANADITMSRLAAAIRDLVLKGLITGDSWSAAMAIGRSTTDLNVAVSAPARTPVRRQHFSARRSQRRGVAHRLREVQGILPTGTKWSATSRFSFLGQTLSKDKLAEKRAEILLKRHGVVTKRAIETDNLGWEWRPIYSALNLMELRGKVRRGYFVEGLPGVQFADAAFIERMRSIVDGSEHDSQGIVAASDPAYVFDHRLASITNASEGKLLTLNRIGTTQIVFVDGCPVLVAYSGGTKIETADVSNNGVVERAMRVLMDSLMRTSAIRRVSISEWNGVSVMDDPGAVSLLSALGFRRDYPNMVMDAVSAMSLGR